MKLENGITAETRTNHLFLGDGGIVLITHKPNAELDVRDANEVIAAVEKLASEKLGPKKKYGVLVDMAGVKSLSHEARSEFANRRSEMQPAASAMLVSSTLTKVIVNFFLLVNKPQIPSKLFTSKEDAIAWLKKLIAGT